MIKKLLPPSYYLSNDVLGLSKDLLGKLLETKIDGQITSGIIVETEAYRAPEDKGSHAFANKRTSRTETMFLEGGRAYIYLCYGIHHLFNIVVGPRGTAHAILIRAIEPTAGIDIISSRRPVKTQISTCNGPGKLSAALGITTAYNNTLLYEKSNSIQLFDIGKTIKTSEIQESPRVGIAYAKEWANKPWRYRIKGNPYTSLPKTVIYE